MGKILMYAKFELSNAVNLHPVDGIYWSRRKPRHAVKKKRRTRLVSRQRSSQLEETVKSESKDVLLATNTLLCFRKRYYKN